MLRIQFGEFTMATWSYPSELWMSDNLLTQKVLRVHYDMRLDDKILDRDRLLEKGPSGKVWEQIKKDFEGIVKLLELIPEETPEQVEGRNY